MSLVLLGLGSNLEPRTHLIQGLDALEALLGPISCSPVFQSQAVGCVGPDFYNLVVAAETDLSALEVELQLKQIEQRCGRDRRLSGGLTLDIDLLTYDQLVGDFGALQLPRPEILTNAFVLWPLSLLCPEQLHPVQCQSYRQLWQQYRRVQQLVPVPFCWRGRELTPEDLSLRSMPAAV